jgi:hypothetical protein
MGQRRRRPNKNKESKQKNIIRCKQFMKPVFDMDSCSKFERGREKENNNCCKNCKFSF